ncbi:hypothetical protein L4X63_22240 [Geomonas sp. Red32]|uniref:hypothetical protein n=1 Tax=Geomonas sp. Red32 TaxID=2912856 RepID=UPI00202CDF12|nr:hypothetical protein [Geomonas sp. Red32]MCM0084309.1 hypothetical protein [Geomonas sp. Red32]
MGTIQKNPIEEPADRSCDIKSWSSSCAKDDVEDSGEKYLCPTCGKIGKLDHEIHHEHFPHLAGDPELMH